MELGLENLFVLLVLPREVDVEVIYGLLNGRPIHLKVLLQQLVGFVELAPLLFQDLLQEVHVPE